MGIGIFHIHFMVPQFQLGANVYRECRCGERDYVSTGGYSPLDREWLKNSRKKEIKWPKKVVKR